MSVLSAILTAHVMRYPLLQPQDAVKLLYQNEFGGGHLLENSAASLAYLQEEWHTLTPDPQADFWEPIGNELGRANLCAIGDGSLLPALNRLFVAGSRQIKGGQASFQAKLALLRQLTAEGALPFSSHELDAYLDRYAREGYPMVRHSAVYREAYHPAYRVMPEPFAGLLGLAAAIEARISPERPVVLAIDGRCGSGKTTLAARLAQIWDADVIHMDDFFLPPPLRTPERLAEPGGNIHYERFVEEVGHGIRSGKPFSYRVFDCQTMSYQGEKAVLRKPLLILEGSYSLHPRFREFLDLRVFTTCPADLQLSRILHRNGAAVCQRFRQEWIPMEERYFEACHVEKACDWRFDTADHSF